MPKFSIIVPVYNVEKYLNRCVDSILNQTFKDFEILLMEDCSPDNSRAICEHYVKYDNRVKAFYNDKNLGVSNTRNRGIDISQGKYICFVDSDDYINEDYLMNFYNQIKDNDLDMIYSGFKYDGRGEISRSMFPINIVKSGIEMIESNPKIFTKYATPFSWRCCFRRQFLIDNDIKFGNGIKYGEDSIFNLNAILKAKRMVCIESFAYNYCSDNENSVSKHYKPTMLQDINQEHLMAMTGIPALIDKKYEYEFDLMKKNLFIFLIKVIDNYKKTRKGFRYRDAKDILNTNFMQDSSKFYLQNKLYERKLQHFYYKSIIKKRSLIMFFIWKYCNLGGFVGIERN